MAYWTLEWIDIQDLRYGDAIANAQKCLKAAPTPFDRTAGTMASATGLLLEGRFDEGLAQLLALKKWALENGWLYSASGVDFAAGPAMAATGHIAQGIRTLEAGIAACDASGSRAMASWNRLVLAELYLRMLLNRKDPRSNLSLQIWAPFCEHGSSEPDWRVNCWRKRAETSKFMTAAPHAAGSRSTLPSFTDWR
jgi:hypothetical protein